MATRTEYRLKKALEHKDALQAELREVQAVINERTAAYVAEQRLGMKPHEAVLRRTLGVGSAA